MFNFMLQNWKIKTHFKRCVLYEKNANFWFSFNNVINTIKYIAFTALVLVSFILYLCVVGVFIAFCFSGKVKETELGNMIAISSFLIIALISFLSLALSYYKNQLSKYDKESAIIMSKTIII